MKFVLASFILSFVALSSQEQTYQDVVKKWYAQLEPHKRFCLDESYIEDDLIDRALHHADIENIRPLKCFTNCIYKKLNAMDDSGEISAEKLKTILKLEDEVLADRIVEQCSSVKEDDACEKAFKLVKCVIKAVKAALKKDD